VFLDLSLTSWDCIGYSVPLFSKQVCFDLSLNSCVCDGCCTPYLSRHVCFN